MARDRRPANPEPWLLVCKPLRPPFNDGSTVLVRTLVEALPPQTPLRYFGDCGRPLRGGPQAQAEVIEAAAMGHEPKLRDKAGILGAVLHPRRRRMPVHFFFTPNRATSSVVSGIRRLQRKRLLIQNVMSAHEIEKRVRLLSELDSVVTLSDDTLRRLVDAGLPPRRIRRIYPGVSLPSFEEPRPRQSSLSTVLYAGDLDAHVASRLVEVGRAAAPGPTPEHARFRLVIAARPKAADDALHRARLERELAHQIASGTVELLGRVADMEALFARVDLQIFAADHLKKKVDIPLVLLEGLARGLPVLSVDFDPVSELFSRARDRGLSVGEAVDSGSDGLARALVQVFAKPPELLLGWRDDARKLAEAEFSAEGMASQYAQLYRRLTSGPDSH